MQIKPNHFYRTRDGSKAYVGYEVPEEYLEEDDFHVFTGLVGKNCNYHWGRYHWGRNGESYPPEEPPEDGHGDWDLISEWQEQEVTPKEQHYTGDLGEFQEYIGKVWDEAYALGKKSGADMQKLIGGAEKLIGE